MVESPSPNAFATGRDPQHAAVAVTTGILRLLDDDELAGVIAHELAHIKNRDTLIQTVVATIAGTIMFLVQMAQFTALFGGFDALTMTGNTSTLSGCSSPFSSP